MRVAIACGGTGGHLFPGLAVAEELELRGHQTLLLVSGKAIDATALAHMPGVKSRALSTAGWPGFFTPKALMFFVKLARSWRECGAVFEEFNPSVILGMGGFTSAVPLYMGSFRKLPTLIHESNAIPGRVTRMVGKRVSRVLLGFEDCSIHLKGADCVVTGTPVRRGLKRIPRAEAAEQFGLDPKAKTILVMGGSQGAHGLNEAVLKTLPRWQTRRDSWQFIHLTGAEDASLCEINYRRNKMTAVVKAFSSEMEACYSIADVIVSRSGAASLTEIGHFGLPSILVPFPAAADDHQTKNAEMFTDHGAARLVPQSQLTPEILDELISELLDDDAKRERMSASAAKLSRGHAARLVAEEVERCVTA